MSLLKPLICHCWLIFCSATSPATLLALAPCWQTYHQTVSFSEWQMWSPLPTWTTPWLEVRTSCLLPTLLSFNPVKGPRPTTTFHRNISWLSVVWKKSIRDQSPDSYWAKEYQDKYGLHFLRTQLLPCWHIMTGTCSGRFSNEIFASEVWPWGLCQVCGQFC